MGGEHERYLNHAILCDWLTPAWAGSTTPSAGSAIAAWAHPRMGGEHLGFHPVVSNVPGSPPHGRGAPDAFDLLGGVAGLTPAWAGSTLRHLMV